MRIPVPQLALLALIALPTAVPRAVSGQVLLTPSVSLPGGPTELLRDLAFRQAELKAVLQRYDSSHPLAIQIRRQAEALDEALGHLGYTAPVRALRDSLQAAEWALAKVLPDQEARPAQATRLAVHRDSLRARYCSLVPSEAYCAATPRGPVMPVRPTPRIPPAGAG